MALFFHICEHYLLSVTVLILFLPVLTSCCSYLLLKLYLKRKVEWATDCQCPWICGTNQECHFPHLPPCISQPKFTSSPHWACTGHASTARELWLRQTKSSKWSWGWGGISSHLYFGVYIACNKLSPHFKILMAIH